MTEAVEWGPSHDIIRLLARQTAAVTLPPPPVQAPLATHTPASTAWSGGSPADTRGSPADTQGRSGSAFPPASDAAMGYTNRTSFNRTLSPRGLSPGGAADDSVWTGGQSPEGEGSDAYDEDEHLHAQWAKEYSPPPDWSNWHDVPWDSSVFRPNEQGLYRKATPKICSCLRPFEPGMNKCLKCGQRRPLQEPKASPAVKKMHWMDPNHPSAHEDPHDRAYAWAHLYEQKKYELQLTRWEQEQEFVRKNGNYTPQLNAYSMAIADSKNALPIHERTELVLFKRNEYLEMRRKQVADLEVGQDCTFCPRLHPKSIGMHGRDRKSLYRWDMKKAQVRNSMLQKQQDAEARNCPFSPALTTTSRKIAEEYSGSKNVHDRLAEDAKRRAFEFTKEQEAMKDLKPSAYIVPPTAKPVPAKRPQSARDRRPGSAPGQRPFSPRRSPTTARAKSSTDLVDVSSPRAPSPGTGKKSRKEAHRASMAVLSGMPSMGTMDMSMRSSGGSPRVKKGFAYKDASASGDGSKKRASTWDARKAKSYYSDSDKPPPPPPKSVATGGKNVIRFHRDHTGLIDAVNKHAGEFND